MIASITMRRVLVVAAAPAAAAEQLAVEREPDHQAGHDREERGDRHHRDVLVRHMRHLVRDHAFELGAIQPAQQAGGHTEHGHLGVAPGGERVRHVGVGDRDPGLGHVRERAEPVDDAVQFGGGGAVLRADEPSLDAARAILSE